MEKHKYFFIIIIRWLPRTTSGICVVGKSQNRKANEKKNENKRSEDSIKHKGNKKNSILNAYRNTMEWCSVVVVVGPFFPK